MEQAMNHSRLISDYLEGMLDETTEASLFGHLSSQAELRSEFASQLAMQKAMLADIQNVTVPEDAMKGLFGTLGFNAPSAAIATTAAVVAAAPVARSFAPLWSAIGASVVTALLMWWVIPSGSTENVYQADPAPVAFSPSSSTATLPSPLTPVAPIEKTREVIRYIHTGIDEADLQQIVDQRVAQQLAQRTEASDVASSKDVLHMNRDISSASAKMNSIVSDDPSHTFASLRLGNDELTAHETHFAFYGRTTPSLSFPEVNDVGDNLSVANFAFTAMYELPGSEHLIGIEAGAENFSQVFNTTVAGVTETYEQNPTLGFVGVAYRFLPHVGFSEIFRPFAHIVAGATEVGPMGKAALGISYQPETMVELMLGWDMSVLYYPTSTDRQVSRKAGFTFGAGIKF
jgi:hypothetical protein